MLSIGAYALYSFRVLELLSFLGSLFLGEPENQSQNSQLERENVLQRGESASPFIVEGDGLTSQRKRECIRVLPSPVAHVVGYETIIGAHNTVYVRRMWQALPCSPGTTNIGTYNTVHALTRLEGCIVPVWHDLVAPSYRCAGYGWIWSLVSRLT